LAVANASSDNISVLLGNGDGTFQAAANYPVGALPRSITVGDFNGDGKADLAAANSGLSDVSVLLGNADGTFQSGVSFNVGSRPDFLVVGEFNRDGSPDLAVAVSDDNKVSVLLNTSLSAGPCLAIERSNSTITISWPFPSTGFVLESTSSLTPQNWQPSGEAMSTNNGRWLINAMLNPAERYFRLHKP